MEVVEDLVARLESQGLSLFSPKNENKPFGKLMGELGWFAPDFLYCFNDECLTDLSSFDPMGEAFLNSFKGGVTKITNWEWTPNMNPMAFNMAGTLYYYTSTKGNPMCRFSTLPFPLV